MKRDLLINTGLVTILLFVAFYSAKSAAQVSKLKVIPEVQQLHNIIRYHIDEPKGFKNTARKTVPQTAHAYCATEDELKTMEYHRYNCPNTLRIKKCVLLMYSKTPMKIMKPIT